VPQDLCHRVGKKSGESEDSSDEEDVSPGNRNASHSHDHTMDSNNKNYFKLVNEKYKIRTVVERSAANGQKSRQ
jgi:hypothetical protein